KELQGPHQAEWTRRLEVELDNLRAAIALALAGGVDPVLAVKFEVALMRFRILRGYSREARNNMRAALLLSGIREPNVARAHALYVGGVHATNQSDYVEATKMAWARATFGDRKSTRLNSSHVAISYAGFCLKKKILRHSP